jgi:hypothetical protein
MCSKIRAEIFTLSADERDISANKCASSMVACYDSESYPKIAN